MIILHSNIDTLLLFNSLICQYQILQSYIPVSHLEIQLFHLTYELWNKCLFFPTSMHSIDTHHPHREDIKLSTPLSIIPILQYVPLSI